MFPPLRWVGLGFCAIALGVGVFAKEPAKAVDFNRDIRPILAGKCFTCHGNDPNAVMANLRLNDRASATSKLADGKFAIVPGNPDKSELIRRIESHDPDEAMPPSESKKSLSAEEKLLLRRWIADGADYKVHWAFVEPVRPAMPVVKQKDWVRNPIDMFVLARLEASKLPPSPEADKRTLIRRLSLDLTGLPPSPREVEAFVRDPGADAYEKVVDRLLASPRYGERMAMDWLDCARYADSNGFQADYERYQYRWRDWVIDAFNRNMPFDQFTIEQLAGDMLPNATESQRIATGFNRNHRINTEGGVIPEEWRVETVIDRLETTSSTWLALTTGCARCHDHKYDPISQREFYGMFAYFNNVPESGTGEERPINHPPVMPAPYPWQASRKAELERSLKSLDMQIRERVLANRERASDWKLGEPTKPESYASQLVARYTLFPAPKLSMGSAPEPKLIGTPKLDPGRSTGAIRTDDRSYADLGSAGDFERDQPFSAACWVNPETETGVPLARMEQGPRYRGWNLYVIERQVRVQFISDWPSNAFQCTSKLKIPLNQWSHLAFTYDGSSKPEGVKLYVDGKRIEQVNEMSSLSGSMRTPVTMKIGRRTQSDFFIGKVDDVALYARALSGDEVAYFAGTDPARSILGIPSAKRSPEQVTELSRLWSLAHEPEFRARSKSRDFVAAQLERLESEIPSVMVMAEMPRPRDAFVLVRGQYDHPGPKVSPVVPVALSSEVPKNRLEFARWIASPENPLTARVAVNRMWERLFGIGIVKTSEDFGTRAEFPSHPELLDWLATEFVRLKWNVKAMLKTIVMSATYRQSSRISAESLRVDPENRLLSHAPRIRLAGEAIRDQALCASGLIVESIGGPSVRPYEPDGLWDETNVYGNLRNYKHDAGSGLYRRSLYTIWKRTAAPPNMTLFDVPSRETCRVRRARTNTPLQALVLLNEETYVEAARALAQRVMKSNDKIADAFELVLSRRPRSDELAVLSSGYTRALARFKAQPNAAASLLEVGESPVDPKLDKLELAAMTLTCSTILNLDEAVTRP